MARQTTQWQLYSQREGAGDGINPGEIGNGFHEATQVVIPTQGAAAAALQFHPGKKGGRIEAWREGERQSV